MHVKDLFTLNRKVLIVDAILFLIGIVLFLGFTQLCQASIGAKCEQSPVAYFGFALIVLSIIHFLISLIIPILGKTKK